RSSSTAEILREGIDQPFARFAGDISVAVKVALEPLIEAMDWITSQLSAIPWVFLFPAIVALVWITSRNIGVTILAVVAMLYLGWFGLTEPDLNAAAAAWETVALMIMSILLCVAVGVPLGIMMAFSDIIERSVKPILDVMQTMPSFVYLIPVLIIFGVSKVAGLIAVTIYAMPPVIRLTNLGIRLVAFDVIEAANAFGATYRQRLTGVLIPLALPNIFAGINQTIMMALAMVVIAALVGAGGLGQLVLQAQSNTQLGRGLEYGFAIVLIAIVIDRTFYVIGERMQEHRRVGH
ncbi:MAG: ABC transporter permease, partial [Alphaproteobacteria bacterium]